MTRTILWFVAAFMAGAVCLIEHFQAWQGEAAASSAHVAVVRTAVALDLAAAADRRAGVGDRAASTAARGAYAPDVAWALGSQSQHAAAGGARRGPHAAIAALRPG